MVSAPLEVSKNGSKVRIGTYFSAFIRMEDEGVEILRKYGGEYSHSPVTQIAGTLNEDLPKTTELFANDKKRYTQISRKQAQISLEEDKGFSIFKYQSRSKSPRHTRYYAKVEDVTQS